MASFKIATLQKTREESVPLSELESANKQYEALTEKYRDLLERSNNMIAKNEHSATLEVSQHKFVTCCVVVDTYMLVRTSCSLINAKVTRDCSCS